MITRAQLNDIYGMAICGSEDPDTAGFYCNQIVEFIGEIIDNQMTADLIADIGGEEGLRKAIADADAGPSLTVGWFMESLK